MPDLRDFPDGTRVRHEAFIHDRLVSTLYGVIQEGFIETGELGSPMKFSNPYDFVKAHKLTKIKSKIYQGIHANGYKITQYLDTETDTWKSLSKFTPKILMDSASTVTNQSVCPEIEDDDGSFVSCISELQADQAEPLVESASETLAESLPSCLVTWELVDHIEVWNWKFWATNEYIETWQNQYAEYLQDEANMNEIEEFLDYEEFEHAYPWIVCHNLPYEEELWIAQRAIIPTFGEVWIDAMGNCWEVTEQNGCIASCGRWIGRWSWQYQMMDLGAQEPQNLVDINEFFDVLQDFNEPPA